MPYKASSAKNFKIICQTQRKTIDEMTTKARYPIVWRSLHSWFRNMKEKWQATSINRVSRKVHAQSDNFIRWGTPKRFIHSERREFTLQPITFPYQ